MTRLIVTLGPSTNTFEKLSSIKSRGVDFVRINMSHSSLKDLEYFIDLSKRVGIPFIIDTEGSQIRTGDLEVESIYFSENKIIELHKINLLGNSQKISIRPPEIIDQLMIGDILYVDFDTLVMRITNISTLDKGYLEAVVISSGNLGNNPSGGAGN